MFSPVTATGKSASSHTPHPAATAKLGPQHLSIRPEKVSIDAPGHMSATVERLVYLGTDLLILTKLTGDVPFQLRVQNARLAGLPSPGDNIALTLEEGASRLLVD